MTTATKNERTSDGELVARYAAVRDEAAFRELVERHLGWVYGVARRLTRDATLAEDVAQGVFLALAAKAKSLAGHQGVAGWLFEAARLGSSSALRQRARQKERERMASEERQRASMSDVERLELAEQLDGAVSKLSRGDRVVILAHFYEQVGIGEIAGRFGTTEGAARKRLERAVEKLRERMGVRKPAETFAAAVGGTAAVVAPQHLGAAVLAGNGTPIALGVSASVQWFLGVGAKLLWIASTALCVTAVVGTVSTIAFARAHRMPIATPAIVPIATTQLPSPADDTTGDVSGPDGKALPNVEVIVPVPNSGGRDVGTRIRTDANGRFTFSKEANLSYVFAYIPGVGISKPVAPDERPVHLQIATAVDTEITLIAPGGGPASGVPLRPRMVSFRDDASPLPRVVLIPDEIAAAFSATTDATGKCTLRGLPRGTRVWLDITDSRFAHLTNDQIVSLESDTATIIAASLQLLKAATLRGRIVNPETDAPLAGIEIEAQSANGNRQGVGGEALSDAQGNFTIGQMTPGAFVVSLDERDQKPNEWVAPAVDATMKEGDEQTIQFQLTRGAILKGHARDSANGKPVAGVSIGLYGSGKPDHAAAIYIRTTDSEGRFEFHVPPGKQHPYIAGSVEGYLPGGANDLVVSEGETSISDFELQPDPAPLVEGTVIGPDGQPVPGATILCHADSVSPFDDASTKADAQGHFHVRAKADMFVRARWKDLATITPTPVTADVPLELVLDANATFTLIVCLVDEDGSPVPGGNVSLITILGKHGLGSHPRPANGDGEVLFDSLKKDTHYSLDAKAPGYGVAQKDLKQVRLNEKQEMTLSMRLKKTTAVIAGRVVDEAGKAVAGAQVVMNGASTGLQEMKSDAAGRFSFAVAAKATALVYVRTDQGENLKAVSVRAGEREVELSLEKEKSRGDGR